MRILYAGTPEIACPPLCALVKMQIEKKTGETAAILTGADAPQGRHHRVLLPSPVSRTAERLSSTLIEAGCPPIEQFKCACIGAAETARIAEKQFDLLVSFAYGKIFPQDFLDIFPRGGINIHPSLLPKYRGPSPLQSAILRQDTESGVTIQRLSEELDAGAILSQERFPLTGTETYGTLSAFVAERAAGMLGKVITGILDGTITERPQAHEQANYCVKYGREDMRIDWRKSAASIDAQIRAFSPGGLCWTTHKGQFLYILEGKALTAKIEDGCAIPAEEPPAGMAAGVDKKNGILIRCGDSWFAASVLQYQAKKALDFRSFLNGAKHFIGTTLGTAD